MPKVPNLSLYISAKSIGDEGDILPADRRQRVFQSDTIILGFHTWPQQACPNYPI